MFRLFPDEMRLSIHFDRTPGQKRPELGNLKYKENEGVREFPNPGVPIKLLIQNEGAGTIYEALPANAFGILRRKLVPFVDDGSPAHFQWPPIESRIPTGHSNFSVTVLEVGQQLAGEKVTLVVSAPISLKKVAPHYGYALLSWFMYWPLYSLFLVAYGATLLWKSFRHNSNMAVERDASPKSGSRPLP
jgi:hypothetical protein